MWDKNGKDEQDEQERKTTYHATFLCTPLISANMMALERSNAWKSAQKAATIIRAAWAGLAVSVPVCWTTRTLDRNEIRVLSPQPGPHVECCNAGIRA